MTVSKERYDTVAVILHWAIAALILAQVVIGLDFPEPLPGQEFSKKPLLPLHVTLGMLTLILAVARIAWRFKAKPPPHAASMKPWEVKMAGLAHAGLYALIFAIPLTGWATLSAWPDKKPILGWPDIGWPKIPILNTIDPGPLREIHDILAITHDFLAVWVVIPLVALHVGAVVKHIVIDRDNVLWRMLPLGRRRTPEAAGE